jgi:hypothetical protein
MGEKSRFSVEGSSILTESDQEILFIKCRHRRFLLPSAAAK